MSDHDLDALDPLPTVLKIIQILRTAPENTAQISIESTKLKGMMKRARDRAAQIQDSDVSVLQQEEIIKVLQSRIEKKSRMLASLGQDEKTQVKDEQGDSTMTG